MRFMSFPLLFLGFTAPVSADVYPMKEGDVFCIGYDKTSNSCSSVQTVKIVDEGEYLLLDLAGFAFGETRLDMIATMEATEEKGQLCVTPGGMNAVITPKETAITEGWQNLIQYQFDELTEQGYCVEHKKCGEDWIAIAWVDGEERRDLSATFKVFAADDPLSNKVQPRYLGMEEIGVMKEQVEECFGKDT